MNPTSSSSSEAVPMGPTERVSAHTPTPWTYDTHPHSGWGMIRGADGMPVATTCTAARYDYSDVGKPAPPEIAANAALIVQAVNERETLIAALRVARKAVYAMAEGSHLLDGFGPRKRTPLDDDLDQVEAALASVGKGVNG